MFNDDELSIETRAEALARHHRELLRSLVKMREQHELTQTEVAFRMGVSQPTVAAFERYDANPTLATIRRYAVAVGARLVGEVVDDYVPRGWEHLLNTAADFPDRGSRPAPLPRSDWQPLAVAVR